MLCKSIYWNEVPLRGLRQKSSRNGSSLSRRPDSMEREIREIILDFEAATLTTALPTEYAFTCLKWIVNFKKLYVRF